jgi:hypothetical protein
MATGAFSGVAAPFEIDNVAVNPEPTVADAAPVRFTESS